LIISANEWRIPKMLLSKLFNHDSFSGNS